MINLKTPPLIAPQWAAQGPPPEFLNVVCVCTGKKYSNDYVYRLYSMVEDNIPEDIPYQFFCLTDRDIPGVATFPIQNNWPSWWAKMNMFNPYVVPTGPTLYLDLDVIITGSLEPIIKAISNQPIIMVENFSPNKRHCAHNSSVMRFNTRNPRIASMYTAFREESDRVIKGLHGDQCAIWRILRDDIANFERQYVVSYKYHCRGRTLPSNARVVIFHGKPDPHEVNDQWVREYWQ